MLWGDQWDCRCGWSNLVMRKRCRECGEDRPPVVEVVPVETVVERVHERALARHLTENGR